MKPEKLLWVATTPLSAYASSPILNGTPHPAGLCYSLLCLTFPPGLCRRPIYLTPLITHRMTPLAGFSHCAHSHLFSGLFMLPGVTPVPQRNYNGLCNRGLCYRIGLYNNTTSDSNKFEAISGYIWATAFKFKVPNDNYSTACISP
jgi:hypothetical protein